MSGHLHELPTVYCAVCQHEIHQTDAQAGGFRCRCACHWTCERLGHHRYSMLPEEIERRELSCYRCGATMPLVEANRPPFDTP
jgi:hypothetical protein